MSRAEFQCQRKLTYLILKPSRRRQYLKYVLLGCVVYLTLSFYMNELYNYYDSSMKHEFKYCVSLPYNHSYSFVTLSFTTISVFIIHNAIVYVCS